MNIKDWKSFNEEFFFVEENIEGNDPEKDKWWEENYQLLINFASSLQYDEWENLLDGDTEMVDATMDSTGKHQALTLLHILDISDLEDIKNNSDEE
jgi:hypothetical protein